MVNYIKNEKRHQHDKWQVEICNGKQTNKRQFWKNKEKENDDKITPKHSLLAIQQMRSDIKRKTTPIR